MDPLREEPLPRGTPVAEVLKRARTIPAPLRKMREAREAAHRGGPESKVRAQKAKGKLTARERIHYLLDDETFEEIGLLVETRATDFGLKEKSAKGDGAITGFGKIAGRDVAIFSQDFTVLGGSLGLAHAQKICRLMDLALKAKVPVIGLLDSGGARIQEGVDSLDGYAQIFHRNVRASGIIPQISVILGPCAGGAVYSPALTDFVFMVEGLSHMFVTGPDVVKAATGEETSFQALGGAETHGSKSGVCHFVAKSEPDCFRQVRELFGYLPSNRWEKAPYLANSDSANRKVPLLEKLCAIDSRKAYRVHHVIWQIADEHKFFEVHRDFAPNIVTGLLRLGGEVVGVAANNPAHMAGALDFNACEKAARFIRLLDSFNIPLLTLTDVPGYWPGVEQEHGGIIRRGAKLLYAYAEATVPKVTVILRKAYGGAYIAMGSKLMGTDFNFALPSAEIAVMGPSGAVEILYARELTGAGSPAERAALKSKLSDEYSQRFASPNQTAATGSLDEIIEPAQLRTRLIRCFRLIKRKRRPGEALSHGNMPL